jgi:signal transduction histidine kinase
MTSKETPPALVHACVCGRPSPGLRDMETRLAQALHDARQQAAALTALIHLLDSGSAALTRDTLHYLDRSASQLADLLERVLDRSAAHERLIVWDVVEDIVESSRLTADVDLDLEIDESLCIRANASLLRRATSNLLDNACRAAGEGGRVRVTTRHVRDATEIIVEDSGPGFGTSLHGHASLGLSVVAEFVGNVHGSFEIRRSSDLGGTLLRVTVPDASGEQLTEGVRPSEVPVV